MDGVAGSEDAELKGYRVRMRVVEEYDVALLAESAEDAKSRAEADVRSGQFEAIQDTWPEEIVSVEVAGVEPYPDSSSFAVPGRCVNSVPGLESEARP